MENLENRKDIALENDQMKEIKHQELEKVNGGFYAVYADDPDAEKKLIEHLGTPGFFTTDDEAPGLNGSAP